MPINTANVDNRLLFVCNSMRGGGAQRIAAEIILYTVQLSYSCTLLLLTGTNDRFSEELKRYGVNVIVMPERYKNPVAQYFYVKRIISSDDWSLVHANLFPCIYYCAFSKRSLRAKWPLVMTEHSTDNRRRHMRLIRPIESFIYRQYDAVVSINNETQKELLSWLNTDEAAQNRFHVIYNGIRLSEYVNVSGYKPEELGCGFTEDDTIIGVVGSLKPLKNHEFLLRALAKLPDCYKLVIVGEGPEKDSIVGSIEGKGLSERVSLLGYRRDVPQLMSSFDLVVVPSKWEGFGLVAVEAMAAGTPVVATRVPGLSEVVDDDTCLVNLDDVDSLASTIIKTIDLYKTDNRKHALVVKAQKYDVRKMCVSYVDLYERLLRGQG